ncbi:MAG: hypothetical protein FJ290_03860 [Planctomycetes bacterium]|nr:hypothetical protein [Planctomycetota bacterium]
MARLTTAVALAAALALAACFRLEPDVVRTQGHSQPQPKARRAFAPPKLSTDPLRPPRMGQWSDDGLRYQEQEETSGSPLLPFPLFRRRTAAGSPRVHEVRPQAPQVIPDR